MRGTFASMDYDELSFSRWGYEHWQIAPITEQKFLEYIPGATASVWSVQTTDDDEFIIVNDYRALQLEEVGPLFTLPGHHPSS